MTVDPGELLARFALMQRVGRALIAAAAVLGQGGAAEIAAQEETRDAARALFGHQRAAGDGAAELQGVITTLCNALCMLATLYAAGRAGEARAALDEAEEVATRHGDAARRALVSLDVANAALTRGEFSRALALLLTVEETTPEIPDPRAQIDPTLKVGIALGEAYNWLGDTARAAAALSRTRGRIAELRARAGAGGDQLLAFFRGNDTLQLRHQTVMVLLDARRFRSAARVLDTVEPTYIQLGPAPAAAMRAYRARIAAGLGDAAGALAILDAIRPVFDANPRLAGKRGVIRTLRARVLIDAGRGAEALGDAREGARLESEPGLEETAWNAHWQHARALAATGAAPNPPSHDPLPAYDDAVASLDLLRRASLGYRLDNLYLKTRRPMVDEAVLAAAARGDATRCLRYADAVKSRFLAGALAAGPPPAPDRVRVARIDELSAGIDARREAGGADDARTRDLVIQRAAVLERMRLDRGALAPPPFDEATILDGLRARGQAALQLYLAGTRVVAVLLHDGELRADAIELSGTARTALVAYAANLRALTPTSMPHRPAYDPAYHGLDAAMLVPPRLLERAMTAKALLVSAHDVLNMLPWAALPYGGRRLFERLPVAVAPNIAAIPLLAARPRAIPRIALLGDPEDAALTPAENAAALGPGIADLAALYGPDRLVAPPVTRAAATLDGFRALAAAEAGRGATLHLACHGTFDRDDPAGSGLKLRGRRLTAAEIALRPLGYAEVTMAACSTGVRPAAAGGVRLLGDDVVGLPASLLEAGAGTVLVSTTIAGAQASQGFLNAYHGRRIAGADAIGAFADTQRALFSEGKYKPWNWMGMTLYAA